MGAVSKLAKEIINDPDLEHLNLLHKLDFTSGNLTFCLAKNGCNNCPYSRDKSCSLAKDNNPMFDSLRTYLHKHYPEHLI